jgi:hypothetical protein
MGSIEMHKTWWFGRLNGRDISKGLGINFGMILNRIFKKPGWSVSAGVSWIR